MLFFFLFGQHFVQSVILFKECQNSLISVRTTYISAENFPQTFVMAVGLPVSCCTIKQIMWIKYIFIALACPLLD